MWHLILDLALLACQHGRVNLAWCVGGNLGRIQSNWLETHIMKDGRAGWNRWFYARPFLSLNYWSHERRNRVVLLPYFLPSWVRGHHLFSLLPLSLSLCFFPFLPFCLGLPCLGCAAADHVPMATANLHWNQGDNPFPCFYSSDPFLLFPSTFRSSPLLSFVTEALGLSRASAPANIRVAAASEQVGTWKTEPKEPPCLTMSFDWFLHLFASVATVGHALLPAIEPPAMLPNPFYHRSSIHSLYQAPDAFSSSIW